MSKRNMALRGMDKLFKTMQRVSAGIGKATPDNVKQAAEEIEREASITVQVDEGRLKNSIQTIEDDNMNYEVSAGGVVIDGIEVDYAGHIEAGTRNTQAYPFMGPAAAKVGQKYPHLIIKGVKQAVRKAGVR